MTTYPDGSRFSPSLAIAIAMLKTAKPTLEILQQIKEIENKMASRPNR